MATRARINIYKLSNCKDPDHLSLSIFFLSHSHSSTQSSERETESNRKRASTQAPSFFDSFVVSIKLSQVRKEKRATSEIRWRERVVCEESETINGGSVGEG